MLDAQWSWDRFLRAAAGHEARFLWPHKGERERAGDVSGCLGVAVRPRHVGPHASLPARKAGRVRVARDTGFSAPHYLAAQPGIHGRHVFLRLVVGGCQFTLGYELCVIRPRAFPHCWFRETEQSCQSGVSGERRLFRSWHRRLSGRSSQRRSGSAAWRPWGFLSSPRSAPCAER